MVKKSGKKNISVFIACPEELAAERKWFRTAIDQLNAGFAHGANVRFEPLGWEGASAVPARRSQSLINGEIDRCDVFILSLHRSWGQASPDAAPYSSLTEQEFHRALDRRQRDGAPQIFAFFKRVDAALEADAGSELEKVLELRCRLEETGQVMYRYIDDNEKSFIDGIDLYLQAYAKGEPGSVDKTQDAVVLPAHATEAVNRAREEISRQIRSAEATGKEAEAASLRIESLQLQAAEEAAGLAKEGLLEHARRKFVLVVSDTANIHILYLAYEFFQRTGDLASALNVLEKRLLLSDLDKKSSEIAASAYCSLGCRYKARGDLPKAEQMYWKSLAINEALGRKEGMASAYGNLGFVYKTRGDFDQAEEMCRKSLAINEALGRKEGMAKQYGNLGILYKTQGDFDKAEEMYRKSLAINEALGRKEGMAKQYGNLGILYKTRGELNLGEEMYWKSLALNETLGRKEGVARQYENLGVLYKTRGDLDRGEKMYRKSLAINEALGRKEDMASDYGNLGILYKTRGDLDRAQEMYQKSLELFRTLHSPASDVVNHANQLLVNLQKGI